MSEQEVMQAILQEIRTINNRLDSMHTDIEYLKDGQKALEDGQKALEDGQNALRRDIARLDRKIDRLGNDIADTLYYVTLNVDSEINRLKEAK